MAEAPEALQASGLGAWARGPAYAWLNVLHLLGLVLLVGGIGILDLRLCGLGREIPAAALARFLTPFALLGLAVAIPTGFGLFAADAVSLAASGTFRWKLALIGLGLANAAAFRLAWQRQIEGWDEGPSPAGRLVAAASLAIWLAVATLGRMIAYT
ncbi:hypothetical protein HJG44_10940 [Enterovirga sp. DB1703]|uniref:DUF6644 domain-containing protein n=1 Tax=Enterovirga aerilata TaxID=2730920 RepID=A0A849I0M5_9HYPH|nr:DUF6644 family protein [Enterovirga sp. DB1703]NNM72892.1 hypothetical protein [Enterovirga sp. DB1703]